MILDLPPKLVLPAPAIIRPAEARLLQCGFLPANRTERRAAIAALLSANKISKADAANALVFKGVSPAQAMYMVTQLVGFGAGFQPARIEFADRAGSGSDLTTYTFTGRSLGPEAVGRVIVVAGSCSTTVDRTINQITVAGNNTTEIVTATPNAVAFNRVSLRAVQLAAGPTGDIVMTLSGAALRAGIAVWALYNLLSPTATDFDSDISSVFNGSLDVLGGGVALAYCFNFHAAGATHTWSGLSESFDEDIEAGVLPHTGAQAAFQSTQTLALSCTPTNSSSGAMVCASFR